MPQRSKVLTDLPAELRKELETKLIKGSFSKYRLLEKWLGEHGYKISKSSLQRYGEDFERRLQAVSRATQQAKSLVEASPDEAGAMSDGPIQLVQTRLFDVLVESEDISDTSLSRFARAIAQLGKATVSQKKWAETMRARLDEQKRAAGETIEGMKRAGGLSPEAYEQIRGVLLGIDPLPAAHKPL